MANMKRNRLAGAFIFAAKHPVSIRLNAHCAAFLWARSTGSAVRNDRPVLNERCNFNLKRGCSKS